MANYNNNFDEIIFLVKKGFDILEIEMCEKSMFFLTSNFEPPIIGSIQSNPYLIFTGKDITSFIENSDYNLASESMFLQRFQKLIENQNSIQYRMSDKHVWRHYQN